MFESGLKESEAWNLATSLGVILFGTMSPTIWCLWICSNVKTGEFRGVQKKKTAFCPELGHVSGIRTLDCTSIFLSLIIMEPFNFYCTSVICTCPSGNDKFEYGAQRRSRNSADSRGRRLARRRPDTHRQTCPTPHGRRTGKCSATVPVNT